MSFRNELNYKLKIFVIILLFVITNIFIFYNKKIKYFNGLIILYFILVIVILNGFKQKEKFDLEGQVITAKSQANKEDGLIDTRIKALQLTDLEFKDQFDKIYSELIDYNRIKTKTDESIDELQTTNNLEHRILKILLQKVNFVNYKE